MSRALVELRAVRKSYGATVAVQDVDLSIDRGEFVVLLGPSGSGKTTILSMLGGFVTPSAGTVAIEGRDVTRVPPAHRPTVTVFQDYALFPHMNVSANVGFGLAMRKVGGAERARRVAEALQMVGLEGFEQRGVHQLSGGQRQRVALARAIAVEPTVLLLGEPLGALDLNLRRQMQEELVRLHQQLGTTFVHVTHDQEEAMGIADTIVVLNHGRIEDAGPPDRVYLRPATLFTATFMGESNLIEGRVDGRSERALQVDTALGRIVVPAERGACPGDTVHLCIRPEHLKLAEAGQPSLVSLGEGRIEEVVFQGTNRRCQLRMGADPGVPLRARVPVELDLRVGRDCAVGVRREDIVMLGD